MDINDYVKIFLPPLLIVVSLIGSFFKIRRDKNNVPESKLTFAGHFVFILGVIGVVSQVFLSFDEMDSSKKDKQILNTKLDSLQIISYNSSSAQDSLIILTLMLQNDIINLQKNQIYLDSVKRAEYINYALSGLKIELDLNLNFIDEIDRNNIINLVNTNDFITGHFEYSLLNESLHLDIDDSVKKIILITIQMMKTGNQLIDQIINCGNCSSKTDNIKTFIEQKNDIHKNLKYIQYRLRFSKSL